MNIRALTGEQLSEFFSNASQRRAELEGQYFILDEHRKILLDKLALQHADDGMAWNKAQATARVSDEFDVHIEGQSITKQDLYQARGDVAICDFEIKRRLNANFTKNKEWNSGKLVS